MPRYKYTAVRIREPGFLGRAAAKRHRRTETRQRLSTYLKNLKVKYRNKVFQDKKTRHELHALEFQIKKIQKTLNNRGELNFTKLFEDQARNDNQQVNTRSIVLFKFFSFLGFLDTYILYFFTVTFCLRRSGGSRRLW